MAKTETQDKGDYELDEKQARPWSLTEEGNEAHGGALARGSAPSKRATSTTSTTLSSSITSTQALRAHKLFQLRQGNYIVKDGKVVIHRRVHRPA